MKMNTWLAALLIAAMFLGICLPLATSVAWAQDDLPVVVEVASQQAAPMPAADAPAAVDGVTIYLQHADGSLASASTPPGPTVQVREYLYLRWLSDVVNTETKVWCNGVLMSTTLNGGMWVWAPSPGQNRCWAESFRNGSKVGENSAYFVSVEPTPTPTIQPTATSTPQSTAPATATPQPPVINGFTVSNQSPLAGQPVIFSWTITGQYEGWIIRADEPNNGSIVAQGERSQTQVSMVPLAGFHWYYLRATSSSVVVGSWAYISVNPSEPNTPTNTPTPTYTPTPRPTNTPWPTYTPTPSTPWRGQTPKWGIYLDPATRKPKLGRFDWVVATYGRKLYLASVTGGNMAAAADLNAPAATATPTPGNWISGQKTIYRFDGETDAWVEVPTSNQDEFAIAGTMAVVGLGLLGDDVTVIGVVDDPIALVLLATASGYAVYGVYREFTDPNIWVTGPDDLLDVTHNLSTGEGLEVNPRSVYVVGDEGVIETRFDWISRPADAVWATTYLYASEVGLAHEPAGVLGTMSFWRDGQEREFYLSVGLPDVPALPDALPLPQVIEKLIGKRYKDVELQVGWPTVGPHEGPDPHGRSQEELETRRQQREPSWATGAQKSAVNVANGKPPCDWLGYVPERDTCYCACYTCVLQAAVDGIKDITGIIQIFSGQAGTQNTAIPLGSGGIPKGWQPGDITRQPTGGQYQPRVVVRDAETKAPILDADGNPVTRPGPRTVDQRNTSDPDYQRCNSLINNKWGPPAAPAAAALGWSEVQP